MQSPGHRQIPSTESPAYHRRPSTDRPATSCLESLGYPRRPWTDPPASKSARYPMAESLDTSLTAPIGYRRTRWCPGSSRRWIGRWPQSPHTVGFQAKLCRHLYRHPQFRVRTEHPFSCGGPSKPLAQCGEPGTISPSQFQVQRIVAGQPMAPCEAEGGLKVGLFVGRDWKAPEGVQPLSTFPAVMRPRRSAASRELRVARCHRCGTTAPSSASCTSARSAHGSSSSSNSHATTIEASTTSPLICGDPRGARRVFHRWRGGNAPPPCAALPEALYRPLTIGSVLGVGGR